MLAYFYMHHMNWGWGVLMTIGMLAFTTLVISGAVVLWRGRRSESTADVLEHRLAAGEISVAEYEQLKHTISGPGGPPQAAA